MTSTFLDCYEEPLVDVVHGYTGSGDTLADLTELHESIGWSAGGIVSTASDLIAFARGLFGGSLFDDPASLVAMTTPPPVVPTVWASCSTEKLWGMQAILPVFDRCSIMRLNWIPLWWCSTITMERIPNRGWQG